MNLDLLAVTAIWSGTVIDGPILIYHDEISFDSNYTTPTVNYSNDPGALVCWSDNHGEARWRRADGMTIYNREEDIQRVQSPEGSLPSLSRLMLDNLVSTDPRHNGLWVCVLWNTILNEYGPDDLLDSFIYVGIYSRNSGESFLFGKAESV